MSISKNSKIKYYALSFLRYYTPRSLFRFINRYERVVERYLDRHPEEWDLIADRVNRYCKLIEVSPIAQADVVRLADFSLPPKIKGKPSIRTYFFDTYQYSRYFPDSYGIVPLFGDVTHVPPVPSITKSRPIGFNNRNSVVLNLDKNRHFLFVDDPVAFRDKKDMLIGRAAVHVPHRVRFMEMYFGHPMCDLGQVNHNKVFNPDWLCPKLSLRQHLDFKFILCLEGYDVATNLKWVMSSNSLPVMPDPKFETWFMESQLKPNYHYVRIADDYSDLEDRLKYYIAHPDEAEDIIRHNHEYVRQFQNSERERVISLLVLCKYFKMTGQSDYYPSCLEG